MALSRSAWPGHSALDLPAAARRLSEAGWSGTEYALAAASEVAAPQGATLTTPVSSDRAVGLIASDGRTFEASYSPARDGKPTFLLLHGAGGRKEEWQPLVRAMNQAGYGTFAPDLRHPPRIPAVYEEIARDIDASVSWLNGSGVPDSALGLMGAELGGTLAAKYGSTRPQIAMLAIFSPRLAYHDIPYINAVRAYRGRQTSILMVYAADDKNSSRETTVLVKFAQSAVGEGNVRVIAVASGRGAAMFGAQADLAGDVVSWAVNPIKP